MFASELKVMAGDTDLDMDIKGLKHEVFLRNHPSGGIGVWFREDLSMRVWNREVSQDLEWIMLERIWLQCFRRGSKVAFCGAYLRTNKSVNHEYYRNRIHALDTDLLVFEH